MKTEKIGIVGLGTVGTGTLKILTCEKEEIHRKTGTWIEVVKACDVNINRDFGFEFDRSILTIDYNEIINNSEISVVVELIGGYGIARDIIIKALKSGKNVVTANKALIAKHSKELFSIARENNVKIYYEASVGGGIPIITPLQESLTANNIFNIKGIINGTSNYILTEMTEKGMGFKEALATAQKLGYAEADPTFDVEGIDTAHKISILASLAYGGYVDVEKVFVKGISTINKEDILAAKEFGFVIKLLAMAERKQNGIEISVRPTLINKSEILASVNDVYNAIEIIGDYVGKVMFYGRGAGMNPTGSAVVADIIKLACEDDNSFKPMGNFYYNVDNEIELLSPNESKSKYYIRLNVKDKVGVLSMIAENFKNNGISIDSLYQKAADTGEEFLSLIIITHEVKELNVVRAMEETGISEDINIGNSIVLRIDKNMKI